MSATVKYYPAERLNSSARFAVKVCQAAGLKVESVVRTKGGVLSLHTITSADGTITYLHHGYTRDLVNFSNGVLAATGGKPDNATIPIGS